MAIKYSDRLVIRRPTADDLEAFLAYRNDPENMLFQPIEAMRVVDAAAFLADQAKLDLDADNCWLMFAIELRESGRMIGEVGMYIESATKRTANIGWAIQSEFRGQGYATEAAKYLLEYAFKERKLHRVTSITSVQNGASVRVMERLGMRREGTTRESMRANNTWNDEHLYGLLNSEWHQQHGTRGPDISLDPQPLECTRAEQTAPSYPDPSPRSD